MTTADLSPQEVARWALRAGLPLGAERLDVVAATSNHIQNVIGALRTLDLQEAPPAATYRPVATTDRPVAMTDRPVAMAGRGQGDAAV